MHEGLSFLVMCLAEVCHSLFSRFTVKISEHKSIMIFCESDFISLLIHSKYHLARGL